jgi:transcription elongation factor GreA
VKKNVNITEAGKRELEGELAGLIAERPAIAERIATARSFGDLSENEEYSSARGEQKVVEGRILEIQEILKNAQIISERKRSQVEMGSSVVVDDGLREVTFTVVGPVEANPLEGKVSNESPLGRALMGRKVGEEAVLETPRGKTVYKVVKLV